MSSSSAYDRFGKPYNISRVITPSLTFDQKAYDAYSPLYLSTTFAMVYMLASAIATCVLVHAGIYYGRSLLRDMQKRNGDRDDVHARLMRVYPEWVTASPCSCPLISNRVPTWWYVGFFVAFVGIAIASVEVCAWTPSSCHAKNILGIPHASSLLSATARDIASGGLCPSGGLHICAHRPRNQPESSRTAHTRITSSWKADG